MSFLFSCCLPTPSFSPLIEADKTIKRVLKENPSPSKITLLIPNTAGFGEIEGGSKIASLLVEKKHLLQVVIRVRETDDEEEMRGKFRSTNLVLWQEADPLESLVQKVMAFHPTYLACFPRFPKQFGYPILQAVKGSSGYYNLKDFGSSEGLLGLRPGQIGLLCDKELVSLAHASPDDKKRLFLSTLSKEELLLFFGSAEPPLEDWKIALGYCAIPDTRMWFIYMIMRSYFIIGRKKNVLIFLPSPKKDWPSIEELTLAAKANNIHKLKIILGNEVSVCSFENEGDNTLTLIFREKIPSKQCRYVLLQSELPSLVTGVSSFTEAICSQIPFFYEVLAQKRALWSAFCRLFSLPKHLLDETAIFESKDHPDSLESLMIPSTTPLIFRDTILLQSWKEGLSHICQTKRAEDLLPLFFQETSPEKAKISCGFFTYLGYAFATNLPLFTSLYQKLGNDIAENLRIIQQHLRESPIDLATFLVITGNVAALDKETGFSPDHILILAARYNKPEFLSWCRTQSLSQKALQDSFTILTKAKNLPFLFLYIKEFVRDTKRLNDDSLSNLAISTACCDENLPILHQLYDLPEGTWSKLHKIACIETSFFLLNPKLCPMIANYLVSRPEFQEINPIIMQLMAADAK